MTLTIHTGEQSLPVARAPRADDAALKPFSEPETAPPLPIEVLHEMPRERMNALTGARSPRASRSTIISAKARIVSCAMA